MLNGAWVEACQALNGVSCSMREIAHQVAVKHGVTVAEMQSYKRTAPLLKARWEAWSRCYYEGHKTKTQIGRFFGNRDHSTITYGINRHKGAPPRERWAVIKARRNNA